MRLHVLFIFLLIDIRSDLAGIEWSICISKCRIIIIIIIIIIIKLFFKITFQIIYLYFST